MKRSSDFFLELTSAIRTSPPVVTVVGIGSLAILVIKVVWLNYLPPVFPRADAAGSIVEGLLGATFAAWIFFVISYQMPQVMERKRVGASIVRLGREASSMVMREVEWIVFGTYLASGLLDAAVENPDASLSGKIRRTVGDRYGWNLRDKGQCATGQGDQGGELNEYRQGG